MPTQPHDRLFRFTFSRAEYAKDALRVLLPSRLLERLDLDRLEVRPPGAVDESLREVISDVLYAVPLRSGEEAMVWTIFDHQSTNIELMALRLLREMVHHWLGHSDRIRGPTKSLPLIIPVVLTHVRGGWTAPRRFAELYAAPLDVRRLVRRHVVDFEYLVDDLDSLSEERLASRTHAPFVWLVLSSLRTRGSPPDDRMEAWLDALRRLRPDEKREPFEALVQYHLAVSEESTSKIVDAAVAVDPIMKETFVTAYDRIIEKGIEEGIEKGIEKGEAKVLVRQLTLKFGELPAHVRERIEHATVDDLDRWAERVLFASTLADVLD